MTDKLEVKRGIRMALTTEDLHNIKHLFDDKFERIDEQFVAVRRDIDNLAIATAQQFAVIDERFAAVDARFEAIDERFDAIDERFAAVDARFEAIDVRFNALDRRFDSVDEDLADVKSVVANHGYRLTRVERHAG